MKHFIYSVDCMRFNNLFYDVHVTDELKINMVTCLCFRAVWFDKKSYPQSWELNPTEGPCRVRKRHQRGHLGIPARFLKEEAQYKLGMCLSS